VAKGIIVILEVVHRNRLTWRYVRRPIAVSITDGCNALKRQNRGPDAKSSMILPSCPQKENTIEPISGRPGSLGINTNLGKELRVI